MINNDLVLNFFKTVHHIFKATKMTSPATYLMWRLWQQCCVINCSDKAVFDKNVK